MYESIHVSGVGFTGTVSVKINWVVEEEKKRMKKLKIKHHHQRKSN